MGEGSDSGFVAALCVRSVSFGPDGKARLSGRTVLRLRAAAAEAVAGGSEGSRACAAEMGAGTAALLTISALPKFAPGVCRARFPPSGEPPALMAVSFPEGEEAEAARAELLRVGELLGSGNACSVSSDDGSGARAFRRELSEDPDEDPSWVLELLGLSDDQARSAAESAELEDCCPAGRAGSGPRSA